MKIIGLLFPLPACPEYPHCSCGGSWTRTASKTQSEKMRAGAACHPSWRLGVWG